MDDQRPQGGSPSSNATPTCDCGCSTSRRESELKQKFESKYPWVAFDLNSLLGITIYSHWEKLWRSRGTVRNGAGGVEEHKVWTSEAGLGPWVGWPIPPDMSQEWWVISKPKGLHKQADTDQKAEEGRAEKERTQDINSICRLLS